MIAGFGSKMKFLKILRILLKDFAMFLLDFHFKVCLPQPQNIEMIYILTYEGNLIKIQISTKVHSALCAYVDVF